LATTRSGLLSPLRSPIATERGKLPTPTWAGLGDVKQMLVWAAAGLGGVVASSIATSTAQIRRPRRSFNRRVTVSLQHRPHAMRMR
jgi:hypothetical protein